MENADISLARASDGSLRVRLSGDWQLRGRVPSTSTIEQAIAAQPPRLTFDAAGLGEWDSSLLTSLVRILDACRAQQVSADRDGLPSGVRRLLSLAEAVPEKKGARRDISRAPLLARIGTEAVRLGQETNRILEF